MATIGRPAISSALSTAFGLAAIIACVFFWLVEVLIRFITFNFLLLCAVTALTFGYFNRLTLQALNHKI